MHVHLLGRSPAEEPPHLSVTKVLPWAYVMSPKFFRRCTIVQLLCQAGPCEAHLSGLDPRQRDSRTVPHDECHEGFACAHLHVSKVLVQVDARQAVMLRMYTPWEGRQPSSGSLLVSRKIGFC